MAAVMAALRTGGAPSIRSALAQGVRRGGMGMGSMYNNSASTQSYSRLSLQSLRHTGTRSSPIAHRVKQASKTGFTLPKTGGKATNSNAQSLFRRLFSNTRFRRTGDPAPDLKTPPKKLGISERLKKLTREYGWSVLGVYFMLTALDFPFCYLLVRTLGTDRIGEWEHIIITNVKKLIPDSWRLQWNEWRAAVKAAEKEYTGKEVVTDGVEMAGWGVEEADIENKRDASLATQLALAYAIHKSFIFIRVPLTAALTPKVVKLLRGWGWDIGKRTTKAAKAAKIAEAAK